MNETQPQNSIRIGRRYNKMVLHPIPRKRTYIVEKHLIRRSTERERERGDLRRRSRRMSGGGKRSRGDERPRSKTRSRRDEIVWSFFLREGTKEKNHIYVFSVLLFCRADDEIKEVTCPAFFG